MRAFRKIQPSVGYSVLLHAGFLFAWFFINSRMPKTVPAEQPNFTMIEVDSLPNVEDKTTNQVVQTEKTAPSEKAAPNAFLGEQTQTVAKQTVSMPKTGSAPKTAQEKAVAKADSEKSAESKEDTQSDTAKSQPVITATGVLSKFGIAISATDAESPKPKHSNIIEEASLTAQARGEYVKGFKAGEQTMLNTREFVFYGYFQRIRERLDREWEKSLKERLTKYFYRGRQLASEQDYSTQLLVSLDPAGKIVKVQIIGASGTKDLDDAAIKAFNDAGPFPNPPKGLVDASGQVLVRWDFVLKT